MQRESDRENRERRDGHKPPAAGDHNQAQGNRQSQTLSRQGPGRGRMAEKARDPRVAMARLAGYLKPHLLPLTIVVLLVVAVAGLELLGPYLLGVTIDTFIPSQDAAGLGRMGLLLLATYLVIWAASYIQARVMVSLSQKVLLGMRQQLFEHLQTLSLGFFDRNPPGELMSRLTNDIDAINRVLSQSIAQLASRLLSIVGIVVVMISLSPHLAAISLIVLPLMLLFTYAVTQYTRRGFLKVQVELGVMNTIMEENISGARVVQAYGQQQAVIAKFNEANNNLRDIAIKVVSVSMLLPPILMIMSNLDIAVVAGVGGWLAVRGLVSVGTIATFILYARRFFAPLRELADMYNAFQAALAGAERVFEVMDQVPDLSDAPDALDLTLKGRVEFDNVGFSYDPDVPVLQNVSLVAEPGQIIALVGHTGAGKTTIVNLLTRFYDVTEGAILMDGHDIRTLEQDALRRQIGIVLQDTFLFSNTVMENIRYGRLDATDEEVIAAAKLANADQFIRRLPDGYQTMLSERATNLSQGQRQLLAIARAVLADPHILVLDEATSSVDTRTEVQIQSALLKLMEGRTSFVIAHRLSTIRKADALLVIDGGRVVEHGTHDSLLAKRGFYYNLYMSQFAQGFQVSEEASAESPSGLFGRQAQAIEP